MIAPARRVRQRLKTPAVCHKAQPPPVPIIPGALPHQLHGFIKWLDVDPGKTIDHATYIRLSKDPAGARYYGTSPPGFVRLSAELYQHPALKDWEITIFAWDPWRNPETYTWSHVKIDLQKPFDTALLQDLVVPAEDFRLARFLT